MDYRLIPLLLFYLISNFSPSDGCNCSANEVAAVFTSQPNLDNTKAGAQAQHAAHPLRPTGCFRRLPDGCTCRVNKANFLQLRCHLTNGEHDIYEIFEMLKVEQRRLAPGVVFDVEIIDCQRPIGVLNGLAGFRVNHIGIFACGIDSICPCAFANFAHTLERLTLENNLLLEIPPVNTLLLLIGLSLKNNLISSVPANSFSTLDRLTFLILANNVIDHLDLYVFLLNIVCLFLAFSRSFDGIKDTLSYLDISNNILTTWPVETLRNFRELTILKLGGNLLLPLPDAKFMGMRKLETLDLENSHLRSISSSAFADMIVLKELLLRNNMLTHFEPSIARNMRRLETLDLGQNDLTQIPLIHDHSSLVELYLDRNRIRSINHLGLRDNSRLRVVDLSHNTITFISPNGFVNMANLHSLDLGHNLIYPKNLGPLIAGTNNLNSLNLEGNKIWELKREFLEPFYDNLEMLYLNENTLTTISTGIFTNFKKLVLLDLSKNSIRSIDQRAFPPTGIPMIYLFGNHFVCDQSLRWISPFLRTNHIQIQPLTHRNQVLCSEPADVAHLDITNLEQHNALNPPQVRLDEECNTPKVQLQLSGHQEVNVHRSDADDSEQELNIIDFIEKKPAKIYVDKFSSGFLSWVLNGTAALASKCDWRLYNYVQEVVVETMVHCINKNTTISETRCKERYIPPLHKVGRRLLTQLRNGFVKEEWGIVIRNHYAKSLGLSDYFNTSNGIYGEKLVQLISLLPENYNPADLPLQLRLGAMLKQKLNWDHLPAPVKVYLSAHLLSHLHTLQEMEGEDFYEIITYLPSQRQVEVSSVTHSPLGPDDGETFRLAGTSHSWSWLILFAAASHIAAFFIGKKVGVRQTRQYNVILKRRQLVNN